MLLNLKKLEVDVYKLNLGRNILKFKDYQAKNREFIFQNFISKNFDIDFM